MSEDKARAIKCLSEMASPFNRARALMRRTFLQIKPEISMMLSILPWTRREPVCLASPLHIMINCDHSNSHCQVFHCSPTSSFCVLHQVLEACITWLPSCFVKSLIQNLLPCNFCTKQDRCIYSAVKPRRTSYHTLTAPYINYWLIFRYRNKYVPGKSS